MLKRVFFFQAEDGIRDIGVTGVQTCALPIYEKGIRENPRALRLHSYLGYIRWQQGRFAEAAEAYSAGARVPGAPPWMSRSEERRVGKECRSRWSPYH